MIHIPCRIVLWVWAGLLRYGQLFSLFLLASATFQGRHSLYSTCILVFILCFVHYPPGGRLSLPCIAPVALKLSVRSDIIICVHPLLWFVVIKLKVCPCSFTFEYIPLTLSIVFAFLVLGRLIFVKFPLQCVRPLIPRPPGFHYRDRAKI